MGHHQHLLSTVFKLCPCQVHCPFPLVLNPTQKLRERSSEGSMLVLMFTSGENRGEFQRQDWGRIPMSLAHLYNFEEIVLELWFPGLIKGF